MNIEEIKDELERIARIFDMANYSHGIFELNKLLDKLEQA